MLLTFYFCFPCSLAHWIFTFHFFTFIKLALYKHWVAHICSMGTPLVTLNGNTTDYTDVTNNNVVPAAVRRDQFKTRASRTSSKQIYVTRSRHVTSVSRRAAVHDLCMFTTQHIFHTKFLKIMFNIWNYLRYLFFIIFMYHSFLKKKKGIMMFIYSLLRNI